MSRAEKYVLAILDCLFAVMVGVLLALLLLRYISKTKKLVAESSNRSAASFVNRTPDLRVNEVQAIQSIEETITNAPEAVNKRSVSLIESETPQEPEPVAEKAAAYCVKCREKREMQDARKIVTKNGRNALEGTCPVCGTRLFRFIAR